MNQRPLAYLLTSIALISLPMGVQVLAEDPRPIEVFKLPDCACCKNWIKLLEQEGYSIKVTDLPNVPARDEVRLQHGVPSHLAACHTSIIEGYVVEGHVSPAEIARLLRERPKIKGLFVKGMPKGAPGMEGGEPERYEVIAVDHQGDESVFAVHEP